MPRRLPRRRRAPRRSSSSSSEESKESSKSKSSDRSSRSERSEKSERSERSSSDSYQVKKKQEPKQEKFESVDIINTYSIDFTKCYICLNFCTEPIICRYCGNLACKNCLNKWMKENEKCGVCRNNIIKNDIISPIIMKRINNYISEFDKIKEKENNNICNIHKEKILFFCMKCLKKYCGKCLFFGSEEAQKHQGHNIIEYNELIKSDYYNIINRVNKYQESKKIDEVIEEKNHMYKEEINIIYNKSEIAFDEFKKMLDDKLKEKNDIFEKHFNELDTAKKNLEKKYEEIIINLSKLENINKKIENFEPKLVEEEIKSNIDLINTIREKTPNMEININFCLKNFVKIFTFQEILNSKDKRVDINYPYSMNMKLIKKGEKEFLEFDIEKTDKPPFVLFLYIKFNNKIYNFKKKEKEEQKENKNIIISNYKDTNEESDNLDNKNTNNIIINIEKSENKIENNEQKKEEEKEDEIIKKKDKIKEMKKVIYTSKIPKKELNEISNNFFYFYNYEFSIK